LRQDPATRIWSIIASERAKRPDDFVSAEQESKPLESYDESCPFCPGNEDMTPEAAFELREAGAGPEGPWTVRVVPNKFAALAVPEGGSGSTARSRRGIYLEMNGIGQHEVVIETPDHSKTLATMSDEDAIRVVHTYRERFLEMDKCDWNQQIVIFRNQGEGAGTSLLHPHSQIIGTPIVPEEIRGRLEVAQRYYDDNGTCVYCDILGKELEDGERLIASNSGFVAFCPFASTVPYETWIVPRRHGSSFGVICEDGVEMLGTILRDVLKGMYDLLHNPDYNYVVRSAPHHSAGEPHFHWYVAILPRLTKRAGFEIGSGMNINVMVPEDAAASLRKVMA
jgi:UDPglucose--hexose-1-phosphate uridylyltransferase